MKRMHVHLRVSDLAHSVGFYSALFAAEPAVLKDDYAKWMLDDPRLNFAISTRGGEAGLDHLGFQVDSDEELNEMQQRLASAELPIESQTGAACCYAQSDKHWTIDPQGIAWESYRTLAGIPTFGESAPAKENNDKETGASANACCAPAAAVPVTISIKPKAAAACGSAAPAEKPCC